MNSRTGIWIEPTIVVEEMPDCAAVQVSVGDGDWVSFLAAGSQDVHVFKDRGANRMVATILESRLLKGSLTVQARKFFCQKVKWTDQVAEVRVFCRGAFRISDPDKILLLVADSPGSTDVAEVVGSAAFGIAAELNREHLDALKVAQEEEGRKREGRARVDAILQEKGYNVPWGLGDHVPLPRLSVTEELIEALPVATFAYDVLDPVRGARSAARQIAASGYHPERTGTYDAICALRGLPTKRYLLTWRPWLGKPPYPEVRAALTATLPKAFDQPCRTGWAQPEVLAESGILDGAQPGSRTRDVWDALQDAMLDDRDMNQRVDEVRGNLRERGFEAVAWYQAHHFWSEESWGIYINAEQLDDFALSLWDDLRARRCLVTMQQVTFLAVGLVLAHERFHARVEAASCWQELAGMRPLHARYVHNVYVAQKGTEAWLEEALANWSAWSWFQAEALPILNNQPHVNVDGMSSAVEGSLDLSPAGYRDWRVGSARSTWRRFAGQVMSGKPAAKSLPMESLFQGPLPYDLQDEDVPIRFIGSGTISDAILAHPASFNVPSRRELECALRHLGHQLDAAGGKGVPVEFGEHQLVNRRQPGELGTAHFARGHGEFTVLDAAKTRHVPADRYIIWRIGEHHRGLLGAEQGGIGFRAGGVATDQAVRTDAPDVARTVNCRASGRFRHGIGRILAITIQRQFADQHVDLRRIEAGDRDIEVKVEFREILELKPQQFTVPASVFGQPVVGDDIGADVGLAHVGKPHRRHFSHADQLRGFYAAMTRDDAGFLVDQNRIGEAEAPDGGRDLFELLLRMRAGIAYARAQFADPAIDDFKLCHDVAPSMTGAFRIQIAWAPDVNPKTTPHPCSAVDPFRRG